MPVLLHPDPLQPWIEGKEWTNAATGLHLRVETSAAASRGAYIVWMATYPACSPEPPLHHHPRQTERFSVLSGRMRVRHQDSTRDVGEGDEFIVNPGEPHAMWNPHPDPAAVRWETRPALRSEQWMGMLLALAAARRTGRDGVPGLRQLAVLLRAYRDEICLTRPPPWVQTLVFGPAAFVGRLTGLRADRL